MFEIILERAAEKELRRLSDEVHDRVIEGISTLARNPRPPGAKKLSGSVSNWRIRVGNYRVLYEIADTLRIYASIASGIAGTPIAELSGKTPRHFLLARY